MRRFIKTFDDYETPMVPVELNITREGIASIANEFLRELGKNYDLRRDKAYDPELGNDAWYVERFYQWAENTKTPCRIIYFFHPEEAKGKDPHMAIIIGDLVLDFAHKKLSKDRKEKFAITPPKDYEKYGFREYDLLDDYPSWTEEINPLRPKED